MEDDKQEAAETSATMAKASAHSEQSGGEQGSAAPSAMEATADTRSQRSEDDLRSQIRLWTLTVVLQIVIFLSETIVPILTLLLVSAIDFLVGPLLVITTSPLGLQLGGNGISAIVLVQAGAIALLAKRLWRLNSKGSPQVVPSNLGEEND
jgi:hypothetical protein